MRFHPLLVLLLLTETVFAADPVTLGSIRGSVRFTGVVPPAKKILLTDGALLQHRDLLVDPASKGLQYVAVILENAPAQPKVAKAKAVVVDQKDMVFMPRVVAVRHGQPVRFENSDLCNHSVMATSIEPANQFHIIAGPNHPREITFVPQKRPVPITCILHDWMQAWVYVVPHPYFAVTDQKGTFQIDNVPPGKYTLLLEHIDTNRRERRPLEVLAGKSATLQIDWR